MSNAAADENRAMSNIRKEYAAEVFDIACVIQENLQKLVDIDAKMREKSKEEGGSDDFHRQNQRLTFDTGYEDDSATFDDIQIVIAGVVNSAKELLPTQNKKGRKKAKC